MDLSKGILIATSNRGKIKEIKHILRGVKTKSLSDVHGYGFYVEENGKTFQDNAFIKAKACAERFGHIALADDSGLEVDSLQGRPGVESARYAGPDATDELRNQKLLSELKGVPTKERTARFTCVVCVYDPRSNKAVFGEGSCEGLISTEPRGTNGFGYDPVFEVKGFDGKTMAELSLEEKSSVSHRARALSDLSKKIS